MLEAAAFSGHRWWDLDSLLASTEPVLPHRLREFLPDLVAGELPDEPLDITHRPGLTAPPGGPVSRTGRASGARRR